MYVVDTYDIVENYMPYTEAELFSKTNKNQEVQKFICYDYFFGKLNKTATILLDEYKIELLAAKNKLARHLKEAKIVLSNLNTLKKETNSFVSNPEKTEEFFKNHLEIILLLLILNDKSNSIFEEFFSFLRTRLALTEIKANNSEDEEQLSKIFNICRPGHLSLEIFEKYIEENKNQLLSIESNSERHIYLENTFRDSQAIDRLTQINSMLSQLNLNYCVIYISTANKTKEIFKSLFKSTSVTNLASTEHLSFHRNIYQYFLFDKIKHEFKENIEEGIEALSLLKFLIARRIENTDFTHIISSITDHKFIKLIKSLSVEKSNTIDNHFYLSVYEKYRDSFSLKGNSTHTHINKDEIIRIIKEVDKRKEAYKSSLFNLTFSLSQLSQTYDVIDTFSGLNEYELQYRYGNDIIKNPYQHLPYLLLIGEGFDPALKSALYDFINLVIELPKEKKEILKDKLNALLSRIATLSKDDEKNKLLRALILTYINFIAQPKDRNSPSSNQSDIFIYSEDRFIIDLEKQYDIVKYQTAKIENTKIQTGDTIKIKYDDSPLFTEIVYILIWLYRRTGNANNFHIEKSIEKGMILLKSGLQDPRIYQGVGLAHVALGYHQLTKTDSGNRDEVFKQFELAYNYLNKARDKFKETINLNDKSNASQIILKNFIAISNSIADIAIRRYERQEENRKDFSLLENARTMIQEIKTLFDLLELFYDNYATYSATEMELEYFEAEYFYRIGQKSRAHQKIINALLRSSILKNTLQESPVVDEMFLLKESLINKLNTKIMSEF